MIPGGHDGERVERTPEEDGDNGVEEGEVSDEPMGNVEHSPVAMIGQLLLTAQLV